LVQGTIDDILGLTWFCFLRTDTW